MNVPYVQLRELTLDDVEDRYRYSILKEEYESKNNNL